MLLVHHEGHEEHEGSRSVRKAGGSLPLLWKKCMMLIFLENFATSREDDLNSEVSREGSEGNSTLSLFQKDARARVQEGRAHGAASCRRTKYYDPATSWPGHPSSLFFGALCD
ncbi:hypothetical protein A6X21_08530 [Planctopirus hydrillae]|uniref:Uncharacterized protein n=1 Tax=Planctopirus hydrillae TaxID=1841610 RepID=A0A1C3E896_9PLAN|nr:hypothetical protein A6X21_08530 [Planctopirus hydrillae]